MKPNFRKTEVEIFIQREGGLKKVSRALAAEYFRQGGNISSRPDVDPSAVYCPRCDRGSDSVYGCTEHGRWWK